MLGKQILAIACSGFLFAGMGSVLAAEDATNGNPADSSSYESDASTSQSMEHQTSSNDAAMSDENAASDEYTSQDEAMTGQSVTTDTATTSMEESAKAQTDGGEAAAQDNGRVIGTLIGASGEPVGHVIRTGKAGADGSQRLVVVPVNRAGGAAAAPADVTATTQPDGANRVQRQRLMRLMYQQLQQQALQIRLLREQLAQQQLAQQQLAQQQLDTRSNMPSAHGQMANARQNPLDQVARVVVDRFGQVQAVVLESGVVLASEKWVNAMQGQAAGSSQDAAMTDTTASLGGAGEPGQRRRAIIIFNPQKQ